MHDINLFEKQLDIIFPDGGLSEGHYEVAGKIFSPGQLKEFVGADISQYTEELFDLFDKLFATKRADRPAIGLEIISFLEDKDVFKKKVRRALALRPDTERLPAGVLFEESIKAEAIAKTEADEKARLEAEAIAKTEADEKARLEAEAIAKTEADEKARLEAEAIAKTEADEKARLEAEAIAKTEADEKARLEAEAQAKTSENGCCGGAVEEVLAAVLSELKAVRAENKGLKEKVEFLVEGIVDLHKRLDEGIALLPKK